MVRFVLPCVLLPLSTLLVLAQNKDQPATWDDLIGSARQWAEENLDTNALKVLQSADQVKAKQLLSDIQRELQGEYVIDLAGLKETAQSLIPVLQQYEETYPYAVWLKTRLDYLEVADQFRFLIPPPKHQPGRPPQILPNPLAQKEREVWITKLSRRPLPKTAQPYVSRLKPIFAAQGVPPELVWIAEVESSFDPRARSPAGAAGLFQLTPATAQRYGLKTTWPWDERFNPETSARASAQYLNHLHARFKDWRLALAAYNAGEHTVEDLLTRHKAKSYDAIATYLPAETQLYVPRVEATLLRREGLELAELHLREPARER
jgi:membrane-bound lytic murein transglycosylase D